MEKKKKKKKKRWARRPRRRRAPTATLLRCPCLPAGAPSRRRGTPTDRCRLGRGLLVCVGGPASARVGLVPHGGAKGVRWGVVLSAGGCFADARRRTERQKEERSPVAGMKWGGDGSNALGKVGPMSHPKVKRPLRLPPAQGLRPILPPPPYQSSVWPLPKHAVSRPSQAEQWRIRGRPTSPPSVLPASGNLRTYGWRADLYAAVQWGRSLCQSESNEGRDIACLAQDRATAPTLARPRGPRVPPN